MSLIYYDYINEKKKRNYLESVQPTGLLTLEWCVVKIKIIWLLTLVPFPFSDLSQVLLVLLYDRDNQ